MYMLNYRGQHVHMYLWIAIYNHVIIENDMAHVIIENTICTSTVRCVLNRSCHELTSMWYIHHPI